MTDTPPTRTTFLRSAAKDCHEIAHITAGCMAQTHGREDILRAHSLAAHLATQCQSLRWPEAHTLSLSIKRCFTLLYDGLIALGEALPLLASSIETLGSYLPHFEKHALQPTDVRSIEAATYQLDTLVPLPDSPPPKNQGGPDVLLSQLKRGSKDTCD